LKRAFDVAPTTPHTRHTPSHTLNSQPHPYSRYLNCDGCSEANYKKPTARFDAQQCVDFGFDSIKIDDQGAGPNHDILEWATSFNVTVRSRHPLRCVADLSPAPANPFLTSL
jgi:hypothetical protein